MCFIGEAASGQGEGIMTLAPSGRTAEAPGRPGFRLRADPIATKIQAATSSVLTDGYRTADIFEPGTMKPGTQAMGEAVAAAMKRLPH